MSCITGCDYVHCQRISHPHASMWQCKWLQQILPATSANLQRRLTMHISMICASHDATEKCKMCVQVHSPPAVAYVAVAATAVESPSCSCQTAWPSAPQARHAAAASVVETACSASAAAAAVDTAAAAGSSAQCKHKFRMMPAEQHLLGFLKACWRRLCVSGQAKCSCNPSCGVCVL